jgi:TonB family protein
VLKTLILSAVFAALPTAAVAGPSAPETLQRAGNWIVDYNRDACHLIAQFGTGRDKVIMRLTRYEPGDSFDLDLYGRRLASADVRSKATVDFGLRGTPVEAQTLNGRVGDLPLMHLGSMRLDGWESGGPEEVGPPLHPRQEAAVSGVAVKIGRKKPFRLEFGPLAKPMEQLRLCQADLLKSWGYDPAVQTTLSKPARPANSPGTWIDPSDYPPGAVSRGLNGLVQFRLDVEADGRIAGCHVLARSSPDVFADTTCQTVSRRAKIEPALDATGNPVRSYYVQKVRWQILE